jgi:prepilin-type N-terminal cleavage/methylation domain-containing protein
MKKNKSFFTLVEMMLVLAIIAILFGLGTAMFTKATEQSEITLAKSQIASLVSAVEMYKDRWGSYPAPGGTASIDSVNNAFNFGQWLSKVAPISSLNNGWTGKRPMFVKFKELGFEVGNENYDDATTTETTLYDPWGSPYGYSYNSLTQSFIIYSIGTHDTLSGQLSADYGGTEWVFKDNGTDISDPESKGIISSHLK